MRYCVVIALFVVAVLIASACADNSVKNPPERASRAQQELPRNPSQGFGVDLQVGAATGSPSLRADSATPILDVDAAAIALDRAGSNDPVRIALLAFSSVIDASRVDPSVTDDNDGEDVFVAAAVDPQVLLQGSDLPPAFADGLGQVFRDVRCTRCHSFAQPDGFRSDPRHVGRTVNPAECGRCHTQEAIRVPGLAPDRIPWQAPPGEFDFRGKSFEDIQRDIIAREGDALGAHLRVDERILWALQHGRVPFQGNSEGGPVPISVEAWADLIDAWEVGGRRVRDEVRVDSSSGDRSIAVASTTGGSTGAGRSRSPAIAFLSDPAFAGVDQIARVAGTVHVAFGTEAEDLASGASATAQVVLVRYDLNVQLVDGRVVARLERLPGPAARVTESLIGGAPDGDSGEPSIAIAGSAVTVAFTSAATDLVAGFVDGNGPEQRDVFVRTLDASTLAGPTIHVSPSASLTGAGADRGCFAPSVSAPGDVVVFESDARDLVSGDANGVRDVFYRRLDGAPGTAITVRASVVDGGAEAFLASARGRAWRDPATDEVWIAFESEAAGLESGSSVSRGTNRAYLYGSADRRVFSVTGSSQVPSTAPEIAGDGSRVAFLTPAALDPDSIDGNGLDDVHVLDLAAFRAATPIGSQIRLTRASSTGIGGDATRPCARPILEALTDVSGGFPGEALLVFTCADELLGTSDSTDWVIQFLRDRSELPLVAQFIADNPIGLAGPGFEVRFRDLSTAATTWEWEFSQGGAIVFTSIEQNPVLTDDSVAGGLRGDYDVVLRISDGRGGSAEVVKERFVVAFQSRPWNEIFAAHLSSCSGCHGGVDPPLGVNLSDAAAAYQSLVGVPAQRSPAPKNRVEPGQPEASYLIDVIDPAIAVPGLRLASSMQLQSRAALREIRDWITRGAPR